ncbi:mandelate racemase/muconate lactonizing enzyme family protein [Nitratireductor sp. StC3]|uniref:mandelate racemase/muconate lactonizing enzyme family protein n=1 Tax=Nitratireductor sp. StC3 TaxID=2126741 RepID=UPI000D0D8E38|nr:mandelate racemase/muconate lactonizing enzyme family protein [Nitratireductor sp. StC3]PSM16371.1 mandelate racemase [Nitratireductor sp. StC3]
MKITRIRVYRKDLTYVGGIYRWGRGNAITVAASTVVVLDTDAGLSGAGEFCPCGDNYMEAFGHGTEAAARLLAPALLGQDPRQLSVIERLMDNTIRGHGYAKAPFDAACWDILGKATGQPVWVLLGGRHTDGAPLYKVAPQNAPDQMVAEMNALRETGYRQFQVKVGADWVEDIERIRATVPNLLPGEKAFADANQGWRVDEAIRVARATRDLDYTMEQPCQTYEECLQVRRRIDLPMKLDECVTTIDMVQRVIRDRAAEVVCLKISKQGGLSKARRMRDLLIDNRIPVVAEDSWGGEITTAALAHFAASTPQEFLINTTDLHNYNNERTGTPLPPTRNGRLYAPDAPGLGVEPDFDSLGEPVAVYG